MSQPDPSAADQRLDEINTQWSLLRLAHRDATLSAGPARQALVLRYNRAIRGYVGALISDQHDADEVAQQVVVKMMQGGFAGADPGRGRFRDLLKVAVKNTVRNYWAKKGRQATAPLVQEPEAAVDQSLDDTENALWKQHWQKTVLDLSWRALEDFQRKTPGNTSYTLLKLRADHPDDDSPQLAARVSQATGASLRADAVRQQLRRARLRFAQLVVEETASLLDDASPDRVEEELIDMGLMEHVGDFLPEDWKTSGQLR